MADEPTLFERMEMETRRANRISWLGIVVLALVMLKLTAQPALAALLVCAKLGWRELQCARWLRRRDPDPRRGSTLCWCYTGRGLMLMSGVAAFYSILFVAILAAGKAKQQGVPAALKQQLVVTSSLMGIAFLLACLVTLVGIVKAVRHGIKIWMHSQIHDAYQRDQWPPPFDTKPHQTGTLGCAAHAAVMVAGTCCFILLIIAVKEPPPMIAIPALIIVIVALVAAMLWTRDWVQTRLAAQHPHECWPELLTQHEEGTE